jgi:hypothetical protein
MKRRPVLLVILLAIVTIGFYGLYWLESTRRELNKYGAKVPTIWLLAAPFLVLIGLALLQVVAHFVFATTEPSTGASVGSSPTVINVVSVLAGVVAVLVLLPLSIFWMHRYCKGAELVTKGATSYGLSMGLWVLTIVIGVNFIWYGVMQDGFNRVGPYAPAAPNA